MMEDANVSELVVVPAMRGSCLIDEISSVEVTFELKGNVLSIVEGGVTGYEGLFIDDSGKDLLKKIGLGNLPIAQGESSDVLQVGWIACMGTKGRWDRLLVPASSMQAVAEYFGLWGQKVGGKRCK